MSQFDRLIEWCERHRIKSAGINVLPNLEINQLDQCETITDLPSEIGVLEHLKSLAVHRTQLASLPNEIGNLSELETLDLWKNQITGLPPEIGKLQKLTKLVLSDNNITTLPNEISNCIELKELWIKGTPLARNSVKLERLMNLLPHCKIQN